MRRAFSATALLWIVVVLALVIQALLALGVQVPLVERSGAWRMALEPLAIGALAAIGAVTMVLIAHGPGPAERRARVLGWSLAVLAVACVIGFDPATAVILASTGRMVYTGGSPRQPTPGREKRALRDVASALRQPR